MTWGVHGPFRDYISRMSDGRMSARDGAEMLSTGEVFFPVDVATSKELRCTGILEFMGHQGMLAVPIEEPWLQRRAGQWHLSIIDPFDRNARMSFVDVALNHESIGTTRLTEAGTDVFMGNYTEKTPFDPLRIVWTEKDNTK